MSLFVIYLIKGYKLLLSPVFRQFGGQCRFHPDCSSYGLEAVQKHGALKGSWLTAKRFVKCGPFHPGGYDPVPEKESHDCDHQHKEESIKSGSSS